MYFGRFDGEGATSSAIDENSIRFLGGTERSFIAKSTGGVGVDFREKSVGVEDAGTWLDIARSAALKLYFGNEAGLSRRDLVGVDRLSECGDEMPIPCEGGGVSILLDVELEDDFGGFINRVFNASCCSFISDGDK